MSNLKYIDEWALDSKSKKIVKKEINKWIKEFTNRASGRVGNIFKCDFKNDDIFFFTDCKDIIDKKLRIRKRKRMVYISLFLKQLIGKKIKINKRKCTSCGNPQMDIIKSDFPGYAQFCPECHRYIIDTELKHATICFKDTIKQIMEKLHD